MDGPSGEHRRGAERRTPAAQVTLPPALTSVPRARHWVAAFLSEVDEEQRQTAVLLTSELVTNAVLHTATDITVTAEVGGPGIRVEVADGSREAPTAKDYGHEAATGRGLTVLDTLADDWGTEIDELGKVVWFELGGLEAPAAAPSSTGTGVPQSEPDVDLVPMALLGVPVPLLVRAQACYDELFREFRLVVERDPAAGQGGIQQRLLDLVDELGTRFSGFTAGAEATWRAAVARGEQSVDLQYMLPAAVGPMCDHYDALLDEADEFCRAAALLTLAPPTDVVGLRKWVLAEFAGQAAGAAPLSYSNSEWASVSTGTG